LESSEEGLAAAKTPYETFMLKTIDAEEIPQAAEARVRANPDLLHRQRMGRAAEQVCAHGPSHITAQTYRHP